MLKMFTFYTYVNQSFALELLVMKLIFVNKLNRNNYHLHCLFDVFLCRGHCLSLIIIELFITEKGC